MRLKSVTRAALRKHEAGDVDSTVGEVLSGVRPRERAP